MRTQCLCQLAARMGLFAGLALSVACSGSVGDAMPDPSGGGGEDGDEIIEPPPGSPSASCDKTGASPLRRLSRSEYQATLRDLFPGVEAPEISLTPDPSVGGFENSTPFAFSSS